MLIERLYILDVWENGPMPSSRLSLSRARAGELISKNIAIAVRTAFAFCVILFAYFCNPGHLESVCVQKTPSDRSPAYTFINFSSELVKKMTAEFDDENGRS